MNRVFQYKQAETDSEFMKPRLPILRKCRLRVNTNDLHFAAFEK